MNKTTEQKRIEYLELVNQIALELASARDPSQILPRIWRHFPDLDCWMAVGLVEGDSLTFKASWLNGVKDALKISVHQGISGRAVRTGQPQLVADVSRDPDYIAHESEEVGSECVFPLVIRDAVIGVLDVQSRQTDFFSEEDCRFFAALANHLVVALDNALTHQALAQRTEELASTHERLLHALAGAYCLLWHATVKQAGGQYVWDVEVPNLEAAQQFLPLSIPSGQSYTDAWYASKLDNEAVDRCAHHALASGATEYDQEYRCQRADGEIRWLHEEVQIQQVGSQRWDLVGVCTDVTERKQMERNLSESESRYRNVIALADGVTYQRDWPGNTYTFMDEGIERLTGYSSNEITPEILESLVEDEIPDPSRSHFFHDEMSEQIGGEMATRYRADYRLRTRDGRVVWVTDSAVQHRDKTAQLTGTLGMLQDITARVQAEQAFRNIARSIPMGMHMYQLGAEGQLVLVDANPMADEILGIDHEPLIGRTIEEAFSPLAGTEIPNQYRLAASEGKNWQKQYLAYENEHIVRAFDVYAFQVSPSNMIALFVDITERKQAEERERLLQARAEEQQKLAAVGQLAAGIAHDFNNILSGVLGHAEMAQMRIGLPDSTRQSLQVIHQQGQRAAKLVQQILDFSRKSIQQKHPLELVPFLRENIKLLERIIPESIQVSMDCPADDYMVHADATQLQQVLTNLALNAKDAMPDGGELRIQLTSKMLDAGQLAASAEAEMEPGEWIAVSVADTGCGIPSEILEHIYEPFFTTKEVGQGSGLGLSQVYGIMQQHGGFIEVRSETGKGTTFVLYFPVLEPSARAASAPSPSAIPRGQGETVLVVEDNPTVLDVVKKMLVSLDYQVLTARDGEDALRTFRQHHSEVSVILTDMVMPRMGGLELHQLLHQAGVDMRIVLMSGYPLGDDARELHTEGVVGWVQKPMSIARLAQVLWEAIRG